MELEKYTDVAKVGLNSATSGSVWLTQPGHWNSGLLADFQRPQECVSNEGWQFEHLQDCTWVHCAAVTFFSVNKATVIITTCMSFSIWTTVNLLLLTPVYSVTPVLLKEWPVVTNFKILYLYHDYFLYTHPMQSWKWHTINTQFKKQHRSYLAVLLQITSLSSFLSTSL